MNYNNTGTLPERGRDIMTLKYLGGGKYRSVISLRVDGKPTSRKSTFTASNSMEAKVKEAEFIKKIHACSLTSETFSAGVEHAISSGSANAQPWVYERIKTELGKYRVDKTFLSPYHDFIQRLKAEGKAVNTISHHKAAIRVCINHMIRRGIIDKSPIVDYEIRSEFRDRVWTEQERERIYNFMMLSGSHLLEAVRFAEQRPVRKGDLWDFTRDNLVLVGECAPYIRFRAQKTDNENVKNRRDTILPLYNKDGSKLWETLEYFERVGRDFPDCPYLFPYIIDGRAVKMGYPKRHWNTICRNADVEDFHFHDLKHCAITHMLDTGWTVQDLLNLNIQFSDELLKKCYYNRNAFKVLQGIGCITESITNRPGSLEQCGRAQV